jgi:hypothetical protein
MAAPGITINVRETRDVTKFLKKLPVEFREQSLAKAMRNAGSIFAKEVRRKTAKLDGSSYNRPSWGRNTTPGTLTKSIRGAKRVRKDVPSHVIKVRVTTKGLGSRYASMAEYGHEKWIFGNKYQGRNDKKTPASGFWRSSVDETQLQVEKRIKEILTAEMRKLINA